MLLGAGRTVAVGASRDSRSASGTLAGDAEVGTGLGQRGQQTVDVTAQAAAVGRNCRGVNEDAGRHWYSLRVARDGTRTPA